jgi:hypothetical protein
MDLGDMSISVMSIQVKIWAFSLDTNFANLNPFPILFFCTKKSASSKKLHQKMNIYQIMLAIFFALLQIQRSMAAASHHPNKPPSNDYNGDPGPSISG